MSRRRRPRAEAPPLLLITAAIFVTWTLYRFAMFSSMGYRCTPLSEIWFDPYGSHWPLFGSFSLVFLLLFAWNLSFIRNPVVRASRTDLTILVVNAIAVLAVGGALYAQVGEAEIGNFYRRNPEEWNVSRPVHGRGDLCARAIEYVGRWQVVSRERPTARRQFPAGWIEFRRNLTFEAADSRSGPIESGHWSPESWTDIIWLYSDVWGESIWEPAFEHDGTLVLTTPSFESDAGTTITLRRTR